MRAVSIDGKDAVIVVFGVGSGAAAAKGGGALGAVGAGAATGGATGGVTVDGTTVSTAGDTVMRIECVSSLISAALRGSLPKRVPSTLNWPWYAKASEPSPPPFWAPPHADMAAMAIKGTHSPMRDILAEEIIIRGEE